MKKQITLGLGALAIMALAAPAVADTFTLRIGSGHPNGPAIYVTDTANFFVPEVVRRVAEETDHEIEFVEGYGGAMAGVAETLEAVQNGILDNRIRVKRWPPCALSTMTCLG
jgi:TRAP-type C4-dicarboxylate transport system substrate-binding protein